MPIVLAVAARTGQVSAPQHKSVPLLIKSATSGDGKTTYVTNEGSNDVTVVDLATGRTATIAVGNAPRKVVVQQTAPITRKGS